MGSRERRERQRAELKDLIKQTAKDIFIKDGYDKVSMRKIADRIEYTPTTIYLYYKDKKTLMFDILNDYNKEFEATVNEIKNSDETAIIKLRRYLLQYIEHGISNPEMFRLLTMFFMEKKDNVAGQQNESFVYMRELITEAIKNNMLKDENPVRIAQQSWMHAFGIASLLVFKPEINWIARDKIVEDTLDIFLNGLRPNM
jgi:AcrR family transcriptional regulator